MNDKIPIWLCIVFLIIIFILGGVGGYFATGIYNNRDRNDIDNVKIEEGRRIINSQREAIERLGSGATASTGIIIKQLQRFKQYEKIIANLEKDHLQAIENISESISDIQEASLSTNKAGNEIQEVINIMETIKNRE